MTKRSLVLLAGLGLAATACKDSTGVGDLNNVSSAAIEGELSRSTLQLLVTGLANSTRGDLDGRYLVFTQTMARDFYRLDNAENRYITELIGGPADNSAFTGGGAFTQFYVTIRAGNTLLSGIPGATQLSAAEKASTTGFVQTLKALAYYRALETRDSLGIAFDVNKPIDAAPAPFVCKPNVLASISLLLDSAATNLSAGGAAFPFTLPAGYSLNGKFNTPATFLKVNRGLKGKIELYRGLSRQKPNAASFDAAIAALNASFLDVTASPSIGIYETFSTSAGELRNPLADANLYLNPAVADSIEAGDRRASKIIVVAPKTLSTVTSKFKSPLTDPAGLSNPIPVLKNAELILLRAQAKIEKGDLVGATADINAVRVNDGGLAPIAVLASKAAAISAVLYEKRYSLLTESAHRLVDLRAYGRLNATFLKKETAADIFQSALPIPKRELDTRGVTSITPECP